MFFPLSHEFKLLNEKIHSSTRIDMTGSIKQVSQSLRPQGFRLTPVHAALGLAFQKRLAYVLIAFFGTAPMAWGAECGKQPAGWWKVEGGACEISEQTVTNDIGFSTALAVRYGATNVTLAGDVVLDLTTKSNTAGWFQTRAVDVLDSASLKSDHDLTIILTDDDAKKTVEKYGLMAYAGADVSLRDLNITLAHKNERTGLNLNTTGRFTYGVQVGFANPAADSASGETSSVKVRNLTVDLKSTEDSVGGILNDGYYNMSAVRVIRHEDNNGSNAIFESTGKVTLNVEDLGKGGYANGIYVSGDDNQVILNDSEITVKGSADAAALKIGKGRAVGTGGGSITSYGRMELDTTASSGAAAVRLLGRGSELNANFAGSSSVIQSADTAILFGRQDYIQSFDGDNQRVAFRNAKISTTSSTASLIQVDQKITNSRFDLSGDHSLITAANDGWLINVASGSDLDVTLSDLGSVAQGLTQVAGDANLRMVVQNGARWQLAPKASLSANQVARLTALTLSNGGVLDAGSHVTAAGTAQYAVEVPVLINNGGLIDMANGSYADALTIKGNYQGNGGTVRMNSLWNAPGDAADAGFFSDQLVITGQVAGGESTTVLPVGAGGQEAIIDGDIRQVAHIINSLDVVKTGGAFDGAFVGTARTTGAGEAQLTRNGDNFRWTLMAQDIPEGPSILAPEVPGYVQMPRANLEMGYAMLSTLHERVGEHQALAWDQCDTCVDKSTQQFWGRVIGKRLEMDGAERLNLKTDLYGMHIGKDLDIRYAPDNGSRRHTGVYASYANGKSNFYDEYRAVNGMVSGNQYTGNGQTDRVALGLYSTYYTESGSYVDAVGEVAYLRNQYNARNGTGISQNGYSALASLEAGKPYPLGSSNWLIEPQGQLIYQHLNLQGFDDGLKSVEQSDVNGLRARVGVRLAYNKGNSDRRTDTFYVIGNVWHDVSSTGSVRIGRDDVRENYNRTWGEVGLGVQAAVGKNAYFYADGRYEHSFGNERRMGYRGTIGVKYRW